MRHDPSHRSMRRWCLGQDSNLRPNRYERPALTAELPRHERSIVDKQSFIPAVPICKEECFTFTGHRPADDDAVDKAEVSAVVGRQHGRRHVEDHSAGAAPGAHAHVGLRHGTNGGKAAWHDAGFKSFWHNFRLGAEAGDRQCSISVLMQDFRLTGLAPAIGCPTAPGVTWFRHSLRTGGTPASPSDLAASRAGAPCPSMERRFRYLVGLDGLEPTTPCM